MADSYFGMKMGDAISSGASHIAAGLQRRYELQRQEALRQEELRRQEEEMARQQAQRDLMMRSTFAAKGIDYDPANPAAAFESMMGQSKAERDMAQRGIKLAQDKTIAEIEALNRKGTSLPAMGALGVEKIKIGGREVEVPVRNTPSGPVPFSLPQQAQGKPLNQFQTNAAAGVMAAAKLESMIDAAEGKPIGRLGGIGAALPQKSLAGKILRMGDTTAQDFASTRDEIVDLLARIRTGAVITTNEEKIYANKIYSILQDEGVNKKNIQMIKEYFKRALPKGYNPETVSYETPEVEQGNPDFTPEEIETYERMIAEGK